jgi:hypothetical protein
MINYFKSIGIVASLFLLAIFVAVVVYFTYLVAIGLFLIALVYIVKTLLTDLDRGHLK